MLENWRGSRQWIEPDIVVEFYSLLTEKILSQAAGEMSGPSWNGTPVTWLSRLEQTIAPTYKEMRNGIIPPLCTFRLAWRWLGFIRYSRCCRPWWAHLLPVIPLAEPITLSILTILIILIIIPLYIFSISPFYWPRLLLTKELYKQAS